GPLGSWPAVTGDSPHLTNFGRKLLKDCRQVQKPIGGYENLGNVIKLSAEFPLEFGVNSVKVYRQSPSRLARINEEVASAYPLIHERTLGLYLQYLEHKCRWGNAVEKPIYRNLSLCGFVQRLLVKRCASFFARNDKYLLVSGESGASGFEAVGTREEKAPLVLANVLSYDDIKLSALLSVSSRTEFVNEGERTNCGHVDLNTKTLERHGVIVGMIGARLSRRNLMEFQDIVIARQQNTRERGYGMALDEPATTRDEDYRRLWREFYATRDLIHGQAVIDNQRFGPSKNKMDVFDNLVMKRRYAISFDMLLLEAEARAKRVKKLAYIHVVGFGLGVWKAAEQQERIFMETFEQRMRTLGNRLNNVGLVHFSWFSITHCGGLSNGSLIEIPGHPKDGIRVLISKRNPARKLSDPEHAGMLLVVSYAWDGNALPGNEFWMKMLQSTGDSSTACSTLVAELHNPYINTKFCNGGNLHIASPEHGVLHIAEYAKRVI
uniref:RE54994p n=1 Tax=Drosophila melanogaster TaxID=7227 RepID=UPI0026F37D74|nr:Chain A, RE54994p [Drosophila melanogaster]8DMT_B Chain B, RE54994p [Drosophila melanogaster]8DMT_C Chain C, RE54994p [Drosophila melanogaster]8DMT_D Chain D, RE54994p [Drosophila melanogaster]